MYATLLKGSTELQNQKDRLLEDFATSRFEVDDLKDAYAALKDERDELKQCLDQNVKNEIELWDVCHKQKSELIKYKAMCEKLGEFLSKTVSPAWLPEGVRLKRHELLKELREGT